MVNKDSVLPVLSEEFKEHTCIQALLKNDTVIKALEGLQAIAQTPGNDEEMGDQDQAAYAQLVSAIKLSGVKGLCGKNADDTAWMLAVEIAEKLQKPAKPTSCGCVQHLKAA